MKIKVASLVLGLAVVAACGQGKKNDEKVPTAEEFKEVNAPEFFLVQANEDGSVDGKATNTAGNFGAAEDAIATQEDQIFTSENSVVPVVADDQISENSTESFHWGYGGQECYKYQMSYRESYDSPNFDYSKRVDLRYEKCRPVFATKHHRVYYKHMGRVWHPQRKCYYHRYQRNQLAYWHGNDYNYYNYGQNYHGYQPRY